MKKSNEPVKFVKVSDPYDAMDNALIEAYIGIEMKHGGPFGAVVIDPVNSVILGCGHNHVLVNHDPTAHGEIEAIRDACKNIQSHDLSGCYLFTTAYPCPMCMAAAKWANIEKIYYGCSLKDTEMIGFRDNNLYEFFKGEEMSGYTEQVGGTKCRKLFKDYLDIEHEIY